MKVSRAVPCLFLFAVFLPSKSPAQSSPAASNATCKIDKTPPTDTELAFYRQDFKKAADLAAAGYKSDPKNSRSRQLEIDSLIGFGRLDEARKKTDAWTLAEPTNAVAIVTAGELRHAEGDWIESYALMLKALKADPCLPSAFQGLAQYETLSGYHATAQKHLTIAHQLSPNNDNIRFAWINSLNDAQSVAELGKYIQDSKTLDDKRRTSLTTRLNQETSALKNPCELSSATSPVRIPMAPVYGTVGVDHYGLEVAFNGHKRILQIDTRASGLLLTHNSYTGMGLQKVSSSHVYDPGTQESSPLDLFTSASVRIGSVEFKNCNVTAVDNPSAVSGEADAGQRVDQGDGLIGTDIFSRYLVTLDYAKHEVLLEPLPQPPSPPPGPLDALGGDPANDLSSFDRFKAPTMQKWTSIYREGPEIIMPTVVNGKKPTLFMVDTGSSSTVIDTDIASQLTHTKGSTSVIDFAGLRLPATAMDPADLARFDGVHGVLGYPTLQQLIMHIDYRDNLVLFEAAAAHK
ncbi:aspartyl protease family protein [Tunturibacter psychrotolerans]|uniref:Aspartyl protease family protein n=1 Tax=Tunturiibacter psychrotolerans TaxID=3069686 RepID=A0AAU7ZMF2_9BACT